MHGRQGVSATIAHMSAGLPGTVPVHRNLCAGDRLRGTMFLLRLAYARRKVLLMVWTQPQPIDSFLVPNEIDWTLNGLPEAVVDQIHRQQGGRFDFNTNDAGHQEGELMAVMAGAHAAAFTQEPVARMQVSGTRRAFGIGR